MKHLNRQGNSRSTLKRRVRSGNAMQAYDQLPPALRSWLAQAALPWSAQSALRVWQRSLRRSGGDVEEAKRHITQREYEMLKRDRLHAIE